MPVLGTILLIACFAAVLSFSRALLHVAGEPRRPIAWALAVMIFADLPSAICRFTQNMVTATVLAAALAAAGTALLWRRAPVADPIDTPRLHLPRWARAAAAIAFVLVAIATFRNYLWDEYSCHFPVTASLARGVAPAQHPFYPGEPFRYHYAFDVLAAIVRAFTGLRVELAIDVATLTSFALLLPLSAHAGARLAGRSGAALAILLVPFGSSLLQYLLLPELGSFELRWSAIPASWLQSVPPPVISNFFQHPQGFAMPMTLAILLLFDDADRRDRTRTARAAIGALLLGLTSLAQLVFFLILGLALGAAVVIRLLKDRKLTSALLELAFLAASLAIAFGLGGFLERTEGSTPVNHLQPFKSYFGEPALTSLAHHLVLFGLPLLALPLALARAKKNAPTLRAALLTAAIAGFAIPNAVTYERSWDIVKFFGAGAFFANLLFADVLAPLYERKKRALLALIVAPSLFVGVFWLSRMSILDGALGIPKMHFPPPPPIAEAVFDRLGPLVAPNQRVFSTNIDMGMGAGFLTPGFDWRAFGESYMLDRPRCDRLLRHHNAARRHLYREDLDILGVDFLVLSPGDVAALSAQARASLDDRRRFEHLFDVSVPGDLRHVYRVVR